MRYNFVCALANHLNEKEAALEMLGPAFEKMGSGLINHAKVDPDLGSLCGTTRASKKCWQPPSGACPNPVRERGMGVELKSPPAAVHADHRPER